MNEAIALNHTGYALKNKGNYPASLQSYLLAKEILDDANVEGNMIHEKYFPSEGFDRKPITVSMIRLQISGLNQVGLALLYESMNDYDKALLFGLHAKENFEEPGNAYDLCLVNMILGRLSLVLKQERSALIFEQKAYDISVHLNLKEYLGGTLLNLGRIHLAMGNKAKAIDCFRGSLTAKHQDKW